MAEIKGFTVIDGYTVPAGAVIIAKKLNPAGGIDAVYELPDGTQGIVFGFNMGNPVPWTAVMTLAQLIAAGWTATGQPSKAGGGGGGGTGGTGVTGALADWQQFLSQTAEGQSALFGDYLSKTYPMAPGPYQSFLEQQFQPLKSSYLLQSGLGGLTNPFSQFLTSTGGKPLSPAAQQAFLQSLATIMGNPSGDYGVVPETFAGAAQEDPTMQYQLALSSVLPNIPSPFKGAFKNKAQQAFNSFLVNTPEMNFLPWFVNQGFKFF